MPGQLRRPELGDIRAGRHIAGDDTLGRAYSDGSFAASCNDYLTGGNYFGSVGSGNYRIKPPSQEITRVFCDMDTDGGGWTLLFRETFTNQEDGPSAAEMNSSSGDPITGEGRVNPVAFYGAMGSSDILYDLTTHKLVTPSVSLADWTWFMSNTTTSTSRALSHGTYFVDGPSFATAYLHKWSGGQGEISTNTTWDSQVILDYGTDTNHGWALWPSANGVYKNSGGYATPSTVTVRIFAR